MKNDLESTEMMVYPEKMRTSEPLSIADIRKNTKLINDLLREVLKEGIDFGLVPGCGDKNGLFKPGAEKIMLLFKLGCFPEPTDNSTEDCIKYVVRTRIVHIPTGIELGYGLGACSSDEEKYKWRKAVCDEEFEATPDERKRLKFAKKKNSDEHYQIKQVRTNPADINNTILKMACKRSKVDGVITCTAASDIFTQDLEEDSVNELDRPVAPAKPKAVTPTANGQNDAPIELTAKFDGTCKKCGKKIPKGTKMMYSKKLGAFHGECLIPEKDETPIPQTMTKALMTNLQKLATAAGVNLIDRIGVDGLTELEQISPEYASELMKEFASAMDGANQ